ENLGILQELACLPHLFEHLVRHEKVFAAILLATAWSTRGIGNGKFQIRHDFAQLVGQRGFAGAGRSRNNEDNTAHSRFCTCSRNFSTSDFICKPSSVIRSASPATPEVFDSSVLVSRFISCRRKSSFLPTSPPEASRPRKCSRCIFRRATSSWMSLRSAASAAS